MKILMINSVCGIRSTGRICTDIATALETQGHEVKIAYGREMVPKQFQNYATRIGSDLDVKLHGVRARLFDGAGFGSKRATQKFILWVKEWNPDVIHLHNIHGYYINIEALFHYLKNCGKRIIWTLHDCWAFTGHCSYFDYIGCDKWKTGCEKCPQKRMYPACIGLDRSKKNYERKKKMLTGINHLTLVTPSGWLAGLVKQSYLSEYPVEVIHNGVDTNVFKPTDSDLREKYGLGNKKVVLGVAAIWNRRKGLDTFIELSQILPNNYQIILVGLTSDQIHKLPKRIIGIERTNSPQELAALYSLAEVFVNPTLEDNYPTTNVEAIACGTPVITYHTGGSTESAEMYGCIVGKSVEELLQAILQEKFEKKTVLNMDSRKTAVQYVELYKRISL